MLKASIVIPVYNQAKDLEKVLDILEKQTISQEHFEVIVVDNGSTDHTEDLVKEYDGAEYLLQTEYLNSSYSSRNRGIEKSKGEVIVLLDGTVIPEEGWLEGGLRCLQEKKADIVSSDVRFDFGEKITAGKIYDSNNLSRESQIKKRGVAKTASLFVKKSVFEEIGKFKEGAETAEDVIWTRKATQDGFKLEYCHESVAYKKAKTFTASVKKQWRDAKGHPEIWKFEGKNKNPLKKLFSSLIPYHPKKVNKLAANKGVDVSSYVKFKLYFVAYFIWIIMSVANILGARQMDKSVKD